jgi:uncharacterized protein YegP (UPF0339 family)
LQQLGTTYPIISFNIKVDEGVAAGEYDLRFRANNGEVSYIAGGLSVNDDDGAIAGIQGEDAVAPYASISAVDSPFAWTGEMPYLAAGDFPGESTAANNRHTTRRQAALGRSRAASFQKLRIAAEERFKALIEPLLNPSGEGPRFGPS